MRRIILFLLLITLSYAQDSLAVCAIYQSLDGPHWVKNDKWLSTRPLSEWYGITTENGRVTRIELPLNHLSGSLPDVFDSLAELQVLRLDNNNISGTLPGSFTNLDQLKILTLSYNALTGYIFDKIVRLGNLEILDLSHNTLTDSIPQSINALSNLVLLDLSFNQLHYNIPQEIGSLFRLSELLDLSHNQFTGPIPRSIGDLVHLRSLDLSSNNLTGKIPPEIGYMVSLDKRLAIQYNQLTGRIPFQIGNLSHLKNLWLNDNNFEGLLPKEIGFCRNLQSLYFYNNSFEGSLPDEFLNLKKLVILYGQNNDLTGEIPRWISKLPALEQVRLSENSLTGIFPEDLDEALKLKRIDLQYNKLSTMPDSISIPSSLKIINLTGNKLGCEDNKLITNPTFRGINPQNPVRIVGLNRQECSEPTYMSFFLGRELIDFGIIPTDSTKIESLIVWNPGLDPITVRSVLNDSSAFELHKGELQIPNGETGMLYIEFNPAENGSYYETLSVYVFEDSTELISEVYLIGGASNDRIGADSKLKLEKYTLHPNYPDPFENATTIRYDLPVKATVKIALFDEQGKPIRILVVENQEAGQHSTVWNGLNDDGNAVPTGNYFYMMQAGTFMQIRKLVYINLNVE
ncbi:MAG: FlgD immunoglobulin-like domain containing protein [Candidatus Neomarinimicrobiota bacterium]